MKEKAKIVFIIIVSLVVVATGSFSVYAGIYYHADESVEDSLVSSSEVRVEREEDVVCFVHEQPEADFIFYPGGKVGNKVPKTNTKKT